VDPRFLDLGISWRLVVRFTPRPLYPRRKSPLYLLDRRLGGPQNRSGRRGEEKILDPTGTRASTPPPVAIPTALFRLNSCYYYLISFLIFQPLISFKSWGGGRCVVPPPPSIHTITAAVRIVNEQLSVISMQ
jgi:hypothetical protein